MKICDIATVKRGSSPRPIINYISTDGYPWLKISDFSYGERYVYDTKEFIIESSFDSNYGARPIKRFVSRNIESLIANALINDEIVFGSNINIDINNNEFYIKK